MRSFFTFDFSKFLYLFFISMVDNINKQKKMKKKKRRREREREWGFRNKNKSLEWFSKNAPCTIARYLKLASGQPSNAIGHRKDLRDIANVHPHYRTII